MIIKEFTTWLCKSGNVYVYRIFENGNNEMTIEVQRKVDFMRCSLDGSAIRTYTKEQFAKLSVDYINKMFSILRKEAAHA